MPREGRAIYINPALLFQESVLFNLPKPKLLQVFIFKELVSLFCLSTVALLSLVLIGRGLQLREVFFGADLGFADILLLFFYLSPMFLFLIMPIAAMLSVFLTFLRINSDNELVALKASGISLKQLLPAPLLFCSLCTVLALLVSIFAVSWGMSSFRGTIMDIAQTRARLVLQPGVFNKDIPGITIFARKADLNTGQIRHVLVEDRTREKNSVVILAPKGSIVTDESRGEIIFKLLNGRLYRTADKQLSVMGFGEYEVRLDLSQLFKGVKLGGLAFKEMSWTQLENILSGEDQSSRWDDEDRGKVVVELHKRWVFPVACIVLGFFALPLACYFEGLNRQYGIIIILLMFLVYYSMVSFAMNAIYSSVPVWLCMWAPNILFLAGGGYFFRLTLKERHVNMRRALRYIKRLYPLRRKKA